MGEQTPLQQIAEIIEEEYLADSVTVSEADNYIDVHYDGGACLGQNKTREIVEQTGHIPTKVTHESELRMTSTGADDDVAGYRIWFAPLSQETREVTVEEEVFTI